MFLALTLQGCAALLVGTAVGVVGGVAISDDTVQSDIDVPFTKVWDRAGNVILDMGGEIQKEDMEKGVITSKVKSSSVTLSIDALTEKATRLKVKARKNYLPNIKLAHKIAGRIIAKK